MSDIAERLRLAERALASARRAAKREVQRMAAAGVSEYEIARQLGIGRSTVRRWGGKE